MTEVADRLGWHEDTIRRHLRSVEDWRRLEAEAKRRGQPGSGAIPAIALGARVRIPAWWLEGVLAQIDGGPP